MDERSRGVFDLNMPEVVDDELEEGGVQQLAHEEFEEQGQQVSQSVPVSPTLQEVRDHSVCHMPYRSWCAHCVRGRGLGKKKDDALPLLAIVDESTQRLLVQCGGRDQADQELGFAEWHTQDGH